MSKQERAKEYYENGMTLQAIAGRMHVTHVTIRNWLLKQDVELRSRGRRPVAVQ